jgi:hypothetical protein
VVPSSWRLLQAIAGLIEPTHQLRMSGVNEASRLGSMDRLGEGVVEEDVLDV